MKLYHITYDLSFKDKEVQFTPRVPEFIGFDEENSIPRVCFSETLEGAVSACPYSFDRLCSNPNKEKIPIIVFELDTDQLEEPYFSPEYLYNHQYVGDAYYTRECWVLEEVTLKGRLIYITNYDIDSAIHFGEYPNLEDIERELYNKDSCVPKQDLEYFNSLLKEFTLPQVLNQIYGEGCCDKIIEIIDKMYYPTSDIVYSCMKFSDED